MSVVSPSVVLFFKEIISAEIRKINGGAVRESVECEIKENRGKGQQGKCGKIKEGQVEQTRRNVQGGSR